MKCESRLQRSLKRTSGVGSLLVDLSVEKKRKFIHSGSESIDDD